MRFPDPLREKGRSTVLANANDVHESVVLKAATGFMYFVGSIHVYWRSPRN